MVGLMKEIRASEQMVTWQIRIDRVSCILKVAAEQPPEDPGGGVVAVQSTGSSRSLYNRRAYTDSLLVLRLAMRTILPFANPLHPPPHMAPATIAGSQDHLAPPNQEASRSTTPQQPSDLSLLVSNNHPAPPPPPSGDGRLINGQLHDGPSDDQAVQSILEAARQVPGSSNGPSVHWNGMPPPTVPAVQADNANAAAGSSNTEPRTGQKRRLEETDAEDPHNKIRRVVRDHTSSDSARAMPMTTVLCLHAAVAQKSYGTEKRFLCPPPVVHIEGPMWNMRQQQMSMAVVTESGERSFEQKAPLDHNLNASFKFLHVSGTAKTKSFQLSLDIAEPPPSGPDGSEPTGIPRVWASFDSAPVTIISKPSKKTAKTRSISSCILAGGPVSLFNRINSQTVRTKYMAVESRQMCASNVAWSAFNVEVIRRPPPPPNDPGPIAGPQTVSYGSTIILRDTITSIETPPLVIRKVDKGKIVPDDNGPVSQMQKIALQRLNTDGTRHYLSAAGPVPGTPGVVVPHTPGAANQAGTHPLLFQAPRQREEVRDGTTVVIDEVDDYLCWTIVGISKFQYTFFDAFGQNNQIPAIPITPFPTLFTAPLHRVEQDLEILELTASNFFYEHPTTRAVEPLDVYLGPIGPLRTRVFQAAPIGGKSPMIPPFIATAPNEGQLRIGTTAITTGTFPHPSMNHTVLGPLHTIVMVELPSKGEVLKALEEDAIPAASEVADGSRLQSKADRLSGRSLPLLFIRAYDGIGYHSGRAMTCEYLFKDMDQAIPRTGNGENGDWMAAQAVEAAEANLNNWTYRVI
ncbi:hypothetical protein WOLCODRAFT_22297 [Wolfiporia cocos MD-104 SS10]|uniref:Beta-trefoil n=1 Tax=Wolfiporia cocos (strain MD-104) TaxID=742152 RepID=A0A2H3JD25_WOLCO|nr:hypothetical protein WOLCODRAFT_22297 [Wolfiporia cocos MD-104 SS10]